MINWRRDRLPTPGLLGFPGGSDGKESAFNAGDLDLIPGLGRCPGEGNTYPNQSSCLENSTERRTWQSTVHGVSKSWLRLGDFHFTSYVTRSVLKFILLIYSVDLQYGVNVCCTARWFSDVLFHILSHHGLSQDSNYSSMCYAVGHCSWYILCLIVFIY